MKHTLIAAAALSTFAWGGAALAQSEPAQSMTVYGGLGYSRVDAGSIDADALSGRLGARFGNHFGVEGEASFGVGNDKDTLAGAAYKSKLNHSFAAYGVGYLPVTPKLDLFGRVGIADTEFSTSSAGTKVSDSRSSWNYGGGIQYSLTGVDGLRLDYTRQSFRDGPGHANQWGASYIRKF